MNDNVELMYLITGHVPEMFSIDREALQDIFCDFLHDIGFDHKGHPTNRALIKTKYTDDYRTADNELFTIRPYYWGDDESIYNLPNFVYKPENIEIKWYKYPLRSGTCNIDLDADKMKGILNECRNYVYEKAKERKQK